MMRVALCLLVPLALVCVASAPAIADERIGLSRDGVTFTSELPSPLFDPDTRWVPGDSRTATFYVRNQADDTAELSVDVLGTEVDSLLETGDLTISVRGGGGRWRETSVPGTYRLVSEIRVRTGGVSRVDVSVALDLGSVNQSQSRSLAFDFRVLLTQHAHAPVGADDGLLPDTGAPALWPLILGPSLLAAGIVLTQRHRKEAAKHVAS